MNSPISKSELLTNNPSIDLLLDVSLKVTVELGRKKMTVADVLKLGPGSIVELSKTSGEPLDIYINDRLVAKGEAIVVGERYGIRVSEIQADEIRAESENSSENNDSESGTAPTNA